MRKGLQVVVVDIDWVGPFEYPCVAVSPLLLVLFEDLEADRPLPVALNILRTVIIVCLDHFLSQFLFNVELPVNLPCQLQDDSVNVDPLVSEIELVFRHR